MGCRPWAALVAGRSAQAWLPRQAAHALHPTLGPVPQFVSGKVEAVDARVVRRSERAVQLEQAHKAIVGRLNLEEFELRPIPRPQSDSK